MYILPGILQLLQGLHPQFYEGGSLYDETDRPKRTLVVGN